MTFTGLNVGALTGLFGGLAGATVLLYLLKLRRRRVAVPFAPLWMQVASERQSSALFRRLKRLWSLLLQLTLLALVVLALGDPRPDAAAGCGFAPPEPPPEQHTLLLIDTSASMDTLEDGRTRLARALVSAEEVVDAAGANPRHRIMVAAVDVAVRPLTLWTTDRDEARSAIATLAERGARGTPTDMTHATAVAEQILRGRPGAEVVLITDTAFSPVSTETLPLHTVQIGDPGANVGIEAFNVRPYLDDSLTYAIFYAIRNTTDRPLKATLYLYADEEGRGREDFVQDAKI
ncbi:MAG: VWA domain-containing protein, partial [Myxococcota bacterium]|nr:VWA domain-containing protein [Myxococcota bacterium]